MTEQQEPAPTTQDVSLETAVLVMKYRIAMNYGVPIYVGSIKDSYCDPRTGACYHVLWTESDLIKVAYYLNNQGGL